MSSTKTLNLNLQLICSAAGKVERIFYDPLPASQNVVGTVIVNQNCPSCTTGISLNILVHQLSSSSEAFVVEIPEAIEFAEWTLKEESFVSVKVEPDLTDYPENEESKIEDSSDDEPLARKRKNSESKEESAEESPPKKRNGSYSCLICSKNYTTSAALKNHKRYCWDNCNVCYQCEEKPQFSKMSQLFKHSKIEHQGKLVCHLCSPRDIFDDPEKWMIHISSHRKVYDCKICSKMFYSFKEVQPHMDDHYKSKEGIFCKFCDKKFTLRSKFAKHIVEKHKSTFFPCHLCPKEYDTEIKLNLHLINGHWTEKKLICHICRKLFKSEQEKQDHQTFCTKKSSSNEKNFECEDCDKSFTSKGQLVKHNLKCLNANIACHQCSDKRIFYQRKDFHSHIAEEHNKTWLCHICKPNVTFNRAQAWVIHMTNHKKGSKDDRFKGKMLCKLCDGSKYFILRSAFREHYEKYHENMEYLCPFCEEETWFDTEMKLNHHLQKSHWHIACIFCKKEFESAEKKAAHMRQCSRRFENAENQEETNEEKVPTEGSEFQCENCKRVYQSRGSLIKHQRSCLSEAIICVQCDDKESFLSRLAFYEHCRHIHEGNIACPICSSPQVSYTDPKKWFSHMMAHKKSANGEGYECKICQKKFLYSRQHQTHQEDHYKQDMQCRYCDEKVPFLLRSKFVGHIKSVHGEFSMFPCPFCELTKEFDTELKLYVHLIHVHWTEKRFFCTYCREKFAKIEERTEHLKTCTMKSAHNEFICELCDRKFPFQASLSKHIRMLHDSKNEATFFCHLCGKNFTKREAYKQHLVVHEYGELPYECHHCGKKFRHKDSIPSHIQRLHTPKEFCNFRCDQCDSRFATSDLLVFHKRSHEESTAEVCKICNKVLKNRNVLMNHMRRIHTTAGSVKKHQCPHCEYTTAYSRNLKVHQSMHLNDAEKPFQCKFCSKGFINQHMLTRHEWAHTDTRPYPCPTCGKNFRHHGDLKSHQRLHTGEKPYECQVCHQRFSDRGCHRSHMIRHEKEMNITLDKSVRKKPIVMDGVNQNSLT